MRGRHKQGPEQRTSGKDDAAYQRAQDWLLTYGPLNETELRSFYHQAMFLIARDGVMTVDGLRSTIAGARHETLQRLMREQDQASVSSEQGIESPTLLQQAQTRYVVTDPADGETKLRSTDSEGETNPEDRDVAEVNLESRPSLLTGE